MTLLVAKESGSLSSESAAARLFDEMLRRLRFLSARWFVWNPAYAAHMELRESLRMGARLRDFEIRRAKEQATYRVGLRSAPGAGAEDGHCILIVDPKPDLSSFVLAVEIAPSMPASELEPWVASLAERTTMNTIVVGHRDIVETVGAGWLTYCRDGDVGRLPDGAERRPLGGGCLVRAHALEPCCKDEDAVLAIRAVAHAMGVRIDMSVDPATDVLDVPRVAVPTYLKPQPAAEEPGENPKPAAVVDPSAVVNPDETAMLPSPLYVKPALPFSGETTPERLEEIAGPAPTTERVPKQRNEGFDPDETAMVPSPFAVSKAPKTGSFRDQFGPVVVPILSLEEYADLRAQLAVLGEDDKETLERFGVRSPAVHSALKARFAEYFKREPDASTHFVSVLQARIGALRSSGSEPAERGGETAVVDDLMAPPDPDGTAEIDLSSLPDILHARGIPFHGAPSQEASAKPAVEASSVPPRIDTGTEEIQQMDFSTLRASAAAALTAGGREGESAVPVDSGPVSLERFAEIQAALSKWPDRSVVLRHYGFTDPAWAHVSSEMGLALTADSTLQARYEQLYREAVRRVG